MVGWACVEGTRLLPGHRQDLYCTDCEFPYRGEGCFFESHAAQREEIKAQIQRLEEYWAMCLRGGKYCKVCGAGPIDPKSTCCLVCSGAAVGLMKLLKISFEDAVEEIMP